VTVVEASLKVIEATGPNPSPSPADAEAAEVMELVPALPVADAGEGRLVRLPSTLVTVAAPL